MKYHSMAAHLILIISFFIFSSLHVNVAGTDRPLSGQNPVTPKEYLIQYWNKEVNNSLPNPPFIILSKASPLSAMDSANFAELASQNVLSTHLKAFCSSAKLFCSADSLLLSDGCNIENSQTEYINGQVDYHNFQAFSAPTLKFFDESMLKEGTVMQMQDIADKRPERSFLPQSIVSKLPFSTAKINELKQIFKVNGNSIMERIMLNTLNECEEEPLSGQTKRCVGSAEDMIDFATSILGHNVVAHAAENANGSMQDIMIGSVKGVNGRKLTKSVFCHQTMHPYMLYHCHYVPEVRIYEAEILDPISKSKINGGVAVCHLIWRHASICHWSFQNDLAWTVADE